MRIEVVPTVEEIRFEQISNRIVVILDVLRASSTIVTALANGFSEVVPVETVGQAHALRGQTSILAGERHCRKITDFDYNNSPTALSTANHQGKRLILTTTNGTRAIQKAEKAAVLLIGCFLNATVCARHALRNHLDVTLYCAGTRSDFALEDGLAAGLLIHLMKKEAHQLLTCDLGSALEASYLQLAENVADKLMHSTTGKRLVQHGFSDDIRFAGQIDLYPLVPIVKEKRILPYLVS